MTAPTPDAVLHIPTILGEGPIWSQNDQVIYWLDVFRPTINRYDPASGNNTVTTLTEPIYAMGFRRSGGFVAGMDSGFATGDFKTGRTTILYNPNKGLAVNFNDGKVDHAGRFWSGTMAQDWESPAGVLYRLDPDGTAKGMQDGLILSNGLGWSPDCRMLYHTDFKRRTIYAYDFELESGTIANRRPFIVLADDDGNPDGMTVDAEGFVWVAHWDGWCVTRHDLSGAEVLRIPFPVQRPTCPAFGGPDLSTLYVTSATMHLRKSELAAAPLSGALFALPTDTRGLPEPAFKG